MGPTPQPTVDVAAPESIEIQSRSEIDWRRECLLAFAISAALGIPWIILTRLGGLPPVLDTQARLVLSLTLFTITITDLAVRRIPNWATYPATTWAVLLSIGRATIPATLTVRLPSTRGWDRGPILEAVPVVDLLGGLAPVEMLQGLVVGFGVMLLFYACFGGGAGDVKLMAAVGGFLGAERAFESIVSGFLLAGVFSVCHVVWLIGPLGLLALLARALRLDQILGLSLDRHDQLLKKKLPMGPFLAAGVVVSSF